MDTQNTLTIQKSDGSYIIYRNTTNMGPLLINSVILFIIVLILLLIYILFENLICLYTQINFIYFIESFIILFILILIYYYLILEIN